MRAYLKQSGELLTDDLTELWTPTAARSSAERIAELYSKRGLLSMSGLMVMSGAGNILRGADMRAAFGNSPNVNAVSDVIGRLGTVQNTLLLSAALDDLRVPSQVLVAPGIQFDDKSLSRRPLPYSLENEYKANEQDMVVLMAGGDGEDNSSTDGAVANLARQSALVRDEPHRIVKATAYNGVFDADPRKHPGARRFAMISANEMLADYDRYGAVDERSLHILRDAPDNLTMQVYAAEEYTPLEVLSRGLYVGTLVMPGEAEAVYA